METPADHLSKQGVVYDPAAEAAVVGSVLIDPGVLREVARVVAPQDFFLVEHRILFEAALEMASEGAPLDLVTVQARLAERGDLERVGGLNYVVQLLEKTPSAALARSYAAIVADRAARRHEAACAQRLVRLAGDLTSSAEERAAVMASLAAGHAASREAPAPVTTRMCDLAPEAVAWLWPRRFPLGKITLLVGDPGRGKSLLTLDMAARVTRGGEWPDAAAGGVAPVGNVVLLNAEDDPADTIRPRLDAAGADPGRVVLLRAVRCPRVRAERMFNLATDVAALARAVAETGDVRLVVLDPLSAYLGGVDSHSNTEVRTILTPLAALAEQSRAAVVVVSHLNKSAGASSLYRTMGSLAFVAVARAVWAVVADPAEPPRALLLPVKHNLTGPVEGLAYRPCNSPEGGGVPALAWEPEPIAISADEALQRLGGEGLGRRETVGEAAVDWLRKTLADGPLPSAELHARAQCAGIPRRALKRARVALGVVLAPAGPRGSWLCRLPEAARELWGPCAPEPGRSQAP